MGFAALFGWGLILGGTALVGVVCVFALRFAASAANATPGWVWVVPAAALTATASVNLVCRLTSFRVGINHERPLPEMLAVAVVVCGVLAWALRWSVADAASRSHTGALRAACGALVLIPVAVFFVAIQLPALRTERELRIRGDYDEAVTERDAARAARILEANPWLRDDLEHALDGTVPYTEPGHAPQTD